MFYFHGWNRKLKLLAQMMNNKSCLCALMFGKIKFLKLAVNSFELIEIPWEHTVLFKFSVQTRQILLFTTNSQEIFIHILSSCKGLPPYPFICVDGNIRFSNLLHWLHIRIFFSHFASGLCIKNHCYLAISDSLSKIPLVSVYNFLSFPCQYFSSYYKYAHIQYGSAEV
jgi:hypothetical protein